MSSSYFHQDFPRDSTTKNVANIASDQDLGIDTDSEPHFYSNHIHKIRSDQDGFQRLHGELNSPIPPLGLDSELFPQGVSLPKQLFVVDQSTHHPKEKSPIEGSAALLGSPDCLNHETESKGKEPKYNGVNLIIPSFNLQHLALWEAAHFSGIPDIRSHSASSAAFTRGIVILQAESEANQQLLKEKNAELENHIKELTKKVVELQQNNFSLTSELEIYTKSIRKKENAEVEPTQISHGSSGLNDEDYVLCETENIKEKYDDSESRIIATGTLIENYVKSCDNNHSSRR